MVKCCPLCKGEKVIPVSNGVGGDEQQPCTVCGGEGEVDEQPADHRLHIRKYWGAMAG